MLKMNQVHSNADNEIALLVPILVGSHTYTSKSLWWSLVRMVAQNLMQLLVSFNNVGKDSQVCNATSRTSKIWYPKTHTQIDKWGRATKDEPKCGIHENALVAQH